MIQCLLLLYKSVHKLVTVDIDSSQTKEHRGTRQKASTAFIKPPKISFLPRSIAEWNKLQQGIRKAPTISIFKIKLQAMDMDYLRGFILVEWVSKPNFA